MTKAIMLFLSSMILLLYSSLCIQGLGATEYGDVVEHTPVGQFMKTLVPLVQHGPPQERKLCGPCYCCPGNGAKSCYRTNCCIVLKCNGPQLPIGTCQQTTLACDCNNCV
ncbi:hypothetical protein BAE44_0008963 [Dichanthelium oligosanthes]|uniref:DUF7866 domain-containing protein n=1 Tax=Dichanthelium oligosanthes TaxID=888268 RepID=A0A1E5VY24_9POAL|nr:hypothetical protein BAE44_0008963 [Dichanthelium oligosanthes]